MPREGLKIGAFLMGDGLAARKMASETVRIADAGFWQGLLDPDEQSAIVDAVRSVVAQAPLLHPETSRGKKMSVQMTSAGSYGWISDRRGYRYERRHPSGVDWPPIPETVLAVWKAVSGVGRAPDTCLVNFYGEGAKMGLHQDRDEASFDWPVVSISLGDDALFRIGGKERSGKTQSVWLKSGDVLVMSGAARLAYHGIDRIRFGSSGLLSNGGRLNLTLRVVT
jgi:alkylated DNA repair protein (DNA oxidative demethylase)